MNYYQELTLIQPSEVPLHALWGSVYTQVHLALVSVQDATHNCPVGVSFPEYQYDADENVGHLGGKLRVFASDEATLQQLDLGKWLHRLADYVHATGIRPVPKQVQGFASFYRVQAKSGAERMARRACKRNLELDYETELAKRQQNLAHCTLPFVQMNSLSSHHPYNLFIAMMPVNTLQDAVFSTYGLSKTSSVPIF